MEIVDCNLCGGSDYRLIYRMPDLKFFPDEWFNVVECLNCGLGFVNPRPTIDEIQKYYPQAFFEYFQIGDFHKNRYRREAKYLLKLPVSREKRLLDVGCANGDFPIFMKSLGWDAEGLETANSASQKQVLRIHTVPFDKLNVTRQFDVITMWAVLEHAHDPKSYLLKARDALVDNGWLVLNVPNFDSLGSKRLFKEDIPRHLYFFNKRSIQKYFSETGFHISYSHFSDDVYGMNVDNWLLYLKTVYFDGKPFQALDNKVRRLDFLHLHGLNNGTMSTFKYLRKYWMHALDTLLEPLVEWAQKISRSYGQVTYVARKI